MANALAKEGVDVYIVRLPRFGPKTKEIVLDVADRVPKDKANLIHCFVEGTSILTITGLKNIEAVNQKDSLYTHTGKIGNITQCFKRFYKGNIIQLRAKYNAPIKCTPEHPFLVVKKPWVGDNHTTRLFRKRQRKRVDTPDLSPKWVVAKDIQIGDYVVFPRFQQMGKAEEVTMTEDLPSRNYSIKNGYIFSKATKARLCKTTIKVTKEFCRLLGYYIAEGSSKGTQFRFSINKNENTLSSDIEATLRSIGFQGVLSKSIAGNGLTISCSGRSIVSMLRNLCGIGARNKHLPPWWWALSDSELVELVKGIWIGDGTTQHDGFSITSYSKTLLEELRLVYNRLGVVAGVYPTSIKVCGAGIKKLEKLWNVSHPATSKWGFRDFAHITNEYIMYRIYGKKEEIYEGYVYNFKVDPDSSYLVQGYTAHNCQHEYGLYQNLEPDFYGYLQTLGLPIVTTMHAVGNFQIDGGICSASKKVIVHNEFCHRKLGLPSVIIPHGCSPTKCPPIDECKKSFGIDPRIKVVGYVGFISNYKGLETMIAAMSKVTNAGILIGGGWHTTGPETQYIVQLKQRSAEVLGDRCKWLGYIPDDTLSRVYGSLDILIYPSIYATESGALLTAISHGKAVIASNVPPFREKEKQGALITFKGADDLAKKIKKLLKNDELRHKFEEGARKYSQENSWKIVAQKHIELYEQVLKAKAESTQIKSEYDSTSKQ